MPKTDSIPKAERVPTGVPGLDEVIEGGLERRSITLVRGGGGCGKTILSLQFLHTGCTKYDEPGAFISFSESKASIYKTGELFGYDLAKLEEQEKFAFIRHSPHEVDRILKEGGGTVRDTLESIGAKRLVVDSVTAYSIFFDSPYRENEGVLSLFEILKSWNVTALVTEERDVHLNTIESGRLGFLTDSILHLYHVRTDSSRVRGIEIVKMRHTTHSEKVMPFKIDRKGLVVYPDTQLLV